MRRVNRTKFLLAIKNGDLEEVKYQILEGADINAGDGLPLKRALVFGHANLVDILIDAGADVEMLGNMDYQLDRTIQYYFMAYLERTLAWTSCTSPR